MAGQVQYDQLEDPNQFAVTQPDWWDKFFRSVDSAIARALPTGAESGETAGVPGNQSTVPGTTGRARNGTFLGMSQTTLLALGIGGLALFAFTRK